jgi:uncharacterized glyoxalase superfamily protein PhnB
LTEERRASTWASAIGDHPHRGEGRHDPLVAGLRQHLDRDVVLGGDLDVVDGPATAGAGAAGCYLTVPDVEEWHARLRASGPAVSDLEEQPWGMRECSLTDGDGNALRIGQPAG